MHETLRVTGEHQPVRMQQRHEASQNAILGWFVEIDHHIAAEDRIQRLAQRPVLLEQVDPLKANQALQLRRYAGEARLAGGPLEHELPDALRCEPLDALE